MTEFIPAQRDSAAGRRDEIKSTLHTMIDFKESLLDLISEAQSKDDHLTLGYSSWTEYVSTEYAGLLAKLDRADRRLASFALAEIGMSSRAIAPLVGVSDRQVRSDVAQVGSDFPPDEETPDWRSMPSVKALDPTTEKTVVGLDGKRYPAPKPPKPPKPEQKPVRKPRQKATPGAFWDATYELRKKLTTLENVVKRDTFARNRKAIREQHLGELIRYSNRLKVLISALSDPVDGDGPR